LGRRQRCLGWAGPAQTWRIPMPQCRQRTTAPREAPAATAGASRGVCGRSGNSAAQRAVTAGHGPSVHGLQAAGHARIQGTICGWRSRRPAGHGPGGVRRGRTRHPTRHKVAALVGHAVRATPAEARVYRWAPTTSHTQRGRQRSRNLRAQAATVPFGLLRLLARIRACKTRTLPQSFAARSGTV
jgi:hypothetical protein